MPSPPDESRIKYQPITTSFDFLEIDDIMENPEGRRAKLSSKKRTLKDYLGVSNQKSDSGSIQSDC